MRRAPSASWLALVIAAHATSSFGERLTLPQAVSRAMEVDPSLAAAHTLEDRTKLAVLRAQLDRVSVTVDGQVSELWNRYGIGLSTEQALGAEVPTNQGLFGLTAVVSVPLFSGLRVESTVGRAQKLREAQSGSVTLSRNDLALSVARAYWAIRRTSLLTEVQSRSVSRLEEAEQIVSVRVRAGLAPPIDLNRAKLRRLQLTVALVELEGQARQAAAEFAVALSLSKEVELVDMPNVRPLLEKTLPAVELLVEDAKRDRPELAIAHLQVEAQRSGVSIARSGYFPQLSAISLLQLGNNPQILSAGSKVSPTSWNPFLNVSANITFGAVLSGNIFNMLSTYTAVADATYELDRLTEEERRAARLIETNVRTAYIKVQALMKRRTPLVEAHEVAADNLTILEARYAQGSSLVIELLDSQLELTNAELNLSDLDARLALAWLELQAALGVTLGTEP